MIVALYFARRDRKIRLAVRAGHRLMVTPGEKGRPEFIYIGVVNIGHREAQIIYIGWKWGFLKKHYAIAMFNEGLSSALPTKLRDGEEALYFLSLEEDKQLLKKFAKGMKLLPYPRIQSYFVKVQVSTSTNVTFEKRIEKGLRKMLVEILKDKKNNNHAPDLN